MSFVYTTAIKKIRKMKERIKVIPGGTSAGKTFSIIPILIDKAIKNPNISISVVSESFPHLRRGALRDFLKIMKITNRFHKPHWNKTESIYTFSNGSYIEFFGAENDSKLRGARRNILYINECNNISFQAYLELASRTQADTKIVNGNNVKVGGDIYLDYNPTHEFWVEDVIEEGDAEVLTLTYKDNEALDETVIKFLEDKIKLAHKNSFWLNWVNVYVYGKTGKLEGLVFENYEIIDDIPITAKLLGYGCDFGFTNDPTAITAIYQHNGKLILDEVCYKTKMHTNDLADVMNELNKFKIIYADNSEPRTISELQTLGINIIGAKKGADSINYGITLMQTFDFQITKRSTNIIDEFGKYEWLKDKNGKALNIPADKNNHSIDGIRYFVMENLGNNNGIKYDGVNL